ncbi:hypothetical protein FOL47_002865, partial [Perkinsus chesapeaki]
MNFQQMNGSVPPPTIMTMKAEVIQKMKKPEQGICMDLNQFLPRREVTSSPGIDDARSFKLTSSGQLIAQSSEKRKLSGFTEFSVALFRWGVTYSIVHPAMLDGALSQIGINLCDVLAYWKRLVDFLPAIGATGIIEYDIKYRTAVAQLVTTRTHSVSQMLCEDVLPTIMSASLARATVSLASSRSLQQPHNSNPGGTSSSGSPGGTHDQSSSPPLCRHFLRGECRFGDACRFSHTPTNTNRIPLRATPYGRREERRDSTARPSPAPHTQIFQTQQASEIHSVVEHYQDGSGVSAVLPMARKRNPTGNEAFYFSQLLTEVVRNENLEDLLRDATLPTGSINPEKVDSLTAGFESASQKLLLDLDRLRGISSRASISKSPIRPEVLQFLSENFDNGKD